MNKKYVLWPDPIIKRLQNFRSEHFTPEETYDYIVQFILETEDLLLNQILSKTYTEEIGEYRGFSRIVVRGFKVYYEIKGDTVVILAVKFPGQS